MRDGRWIDMRTEEGLVKRVRIEQIVVLAEGEEVTLRQEWLEGEEDEPRFRHRTFRLDAETVWRVLPTNYHPEQLEPPDRGAAKRQRLTAEENKFAAEAIVTASLFMHGLKDAEELSDPQWRGACYLTMVVMYEMTDLSPTVIAQRFGYRSQTPLLTARWRLESGRKGRRQEPYVTVENVRRLAELTDETIIGKRFRSSRAWPYDYTPVLS